MTDRVNLRPAEMKDAEKLFIWRNDPETRHASHNTDEVVLESHFTWLKASLSNPEQRLLWIAEVDGIAVGSCRADRVGDAWELSWTIAPEARGKGFAHDMLSKLVSYFDEPLLAEVKADNIASIKVAERSGFVLKKSVKKGGNTLIYSRQPPQKS